VTLARLWGRRAASALLQFLSEGGPVLGRGGGGLRSCEVVSSLRVTVRFGHLLRSRGANTCVGVRPYGIHAR
jgi:hypothetical protein